MLDVVVILDLTIGLIVDKFRIMKNKLSYILFFILLIGCSSYPVNKKTQQELQSTRQADLLQHFSKLKRKGLLADLMHYRKRLVSSVDYSKNDTVIFYETFGQSVWFHYSSIIFESGCDSVYTFSEDTGYNKKYEDNIMRRCFIDSIRNNVNNLEKFESTKRKEIAGSIYYAILTIAIANEENGYTIIASDKVKIPNSCFSSSLLDSK